jgi:protein-S-isoprenylcysteine O-methyltransferase Ste14
MRAVLRHLLSILLLPFVVVVVVPYGLLNAAAGASPWGDTTIPGWLFHGVGLFFGVAGLGLFAWCVTLFARVGQGTLAPWDPTQQLVAVGPYRIMRNPMISSVALLLIGQACFWFSWRLAAWAAVFILVNHVYFIFFEEPGLEKRFGEPYRRYRASVPRWLPRIYPSARQ